MYTTKCPKCGGLMLLIDEEYHKGVQTYQCQKCHLVEVY